MAQIIGVGAATVIATTALVAVYRRGSFDPLEPVWHHTLNIVLLIAWPLAMLFLNSVEPRFVERDPELIVNGLCLVAFGYVMMILGYCNNIGRKIARRLPAPPSTWSNRRATAMVVVLFLAGLTCAVLVVRSVGSPSALVQGWSRRRFVETNSILIFGSELMAVGIVVGILAWRSLRGRLGLLVMLVVATVVLAIYGKRTTVVYWLWIPVVIAVHYSVKRLTLNHFLGVFLAVLVYSQAVLAVRSAPLEELPSSEGVSTFVTAEPTALVESIVVDKSTQFDVLLWLLDHTPDEFSFKFGKPYRNVLWIAIPRALWEGKPEAVNEANIVGRAILGNDAYGLPPELTGMFYLNFWIPGIGIGMFLLGVVQRGTYEFLLRNPDNLTVLLVYPYLWNAAGLWFTIGGWGRLVPYAVVLTLVTLTIRWYGRPSLEGGASA